MRIQLTVLGVVIAGLISIPVVGTAQHMQDKGGMMSGEMMGKSMMAGHQEMSKLVDQVAADLAALQNEKDLETIKKKLATDQSLLEQLQNHMQHQQGMMGSMMDQMKMMERMKMMDKGSATPK